MRDVNTARSKIKFFQLTEFFKIAIKKQIKETNIPECFFRNQLCPAGNKNFYANKTFLIRITNNYENPVIFDVFLVRIGFFLLKSMEFHQKMFCFFKMFFQSESGSSRKNISRKNNQK